MAVSKTAEVGSIPTAPAKFDNFCYNYSMKSLSLSLPHIIAMVGLPGSGKTHFAEQFAETFAAPFLNADQFVQLGGDSEATNDAVLKVLTEMMKTKQTIIFEGATERRIERSELMKQARAKGYKVLFVWVQTDPLTTQQRALKNMSADEFEQRSKRFSAPHDLEPSVVISGRHTYSTQARTLLKKLTEARSQASGPQPQPQPSISVPERHAISRIQIT